jgi:hypothetical protein
VGVGAVLTTAPHIGPSVCSYLGFLSFTRALLSGESVVADPKWQIRDVVSHLSPVLSSLPRTSALFRELPMPDSISFDEQLPLRSPHGLCAPL